MFRVNDNHGFHIEFENGVCVSTQIGKYNYCDNYNGAQDSIRDMKCKNAEVALWDKNGEWITAQCFEDVFGEDINDDVATYVTPERLADVIAWARARS